MSSQCKKFAPNIFHKTKCSNCFRQKEEHSAEALECNRASRSIARSGYLFVAPDWDFSVPLNRTKRWQRRWFVLYDDGELNYSVDEHPDTIPQGSVDMSKVLEVTAAEQITGHPHSLALTSPDRVTFVKAASREEARWWVEVLAMFPRRHKRNATFPGGRVSPSLPQLGRSASPQPPRPRFLSCTSSGPSPRTNFETPPLKEERESPPKDEQHQRPKWVPQATNNLNIDIVQQQTSGRKEYITGSPPTRDKLQCDDKVRARRNWRNERLRDIATALTRRSPESSLALPAEGLLHLKKGWLWLKKSENEWVRRWIVLCVPTLSVYQEQDEQSTAEYTLELSSVTSYNEVPTNNAKYGFDIHYASQVLTLSAVTGGIRANWLDALKKAAPTTPSSCINSPVTPCSNTPSTPRSSCFSSDEEYRTASENGGRRSGDWSEFSPTSPLDKFNLFRLKDRGRLRVKLTRSQSSRHNTVDSTSTDELDCVKEVDQIDFGGNNIKHSSLELIELQNQLTKALKEKNELEGEIARLKQFQSDAITYENKVKDLIQNFDKTEKELNQRNSQMEIKYKKEQKTLQHKLREVEDASKNFEGKVGILSRELQTKQHVILSLQEELANTKEKYFHSLQENEKLSNTLQELNNKLPHMNSKELKSITDLIDIDFELNIENLNNEDVKNYSYALRLRLEKALLEIRALQNKLKEAHENCDNLELINLRLNNSLTALKDEHQTEVNMLVGRVDDLTSKLITSEKQIRSKLKAEQRDKRRSLSLKGRESFSLNKEVEDKIVELEAKIVALEKGGKSKRKFREKRDRSSERNSPVDEKTLRRWRRKSLDSATYLEPPKILMRLNTLESKVTDINVSSESLNVSNSDLSNFEEVKALDQELLKKAFNSAKKKLDECIISLKNIIGSKSSPNYSILEHHLYELKDILTKSNNVLNSGEMDVIQSTANSIVLQFENLLAEKLVSLHNKKNLLQENNEYDWSAKLHLFAEKIAFENTLIGRIQEAFRVAPNEENGHIRLVDKELKETAYLINSLNKKFNGNIDKVPPNPKTSAEHLSKILAKALVSVSQGFSSIKTYAYNHPSLNLLIEEQSKLNRQLTLYKSQKLPQLADSLAHETIHLITDKGCMLKSVANETQHQFTQLSREKINVELIKAEINHVMLRTAQTYQNNFESDNKYFFSFFASERAALELWSDSVEDYLHEEISVTINEVIELYNKSLNRLQRRNWRNLMISQQLQEPSGNLLNEFADIMAHKALIDARIGVLSGKFNINNVAQNDDLLKGLIANEECWSCLESQSVQINQSLEAEFLCMLDRYTDKCISSIKEVDIATVLCCLNDLSKEIAQLRNLVSLPEKENVMFYEFSEVHSKCMRLRDVLIDISRVLKESKSGFIISETVKQAYLGTEYLAQVENLRATYHCVLASCKERNPDTESDIEQLKQLCERVLLTMEQWHYQTIQEMKDRHSREMEMLREEKEQALKEETQATLAALDAMRKAHEAEVQREVAKFKQDYTRQQRDEVMELSEKLSVKRLEAAALSEELSNASRQLAHAQKLLALEQNPQITKIQVNVN